MIFFFFSFLCVPVEFAFRSRPLFIWHSLSPLRHPPGHAYFDPNDFLEGIQQDIEREELEYEVKYEAPSLYLHSPPFNEDLHSDRDALLVHKRTQGRLCVSSPMAALATANRDISQLLMGRSAGVQTLRCRPDRNRVAGLFQQMHNGDIITY